MFSSPPELTRQELRAAIITEPLIASPDTPVLEAIARMSGERAYCSVTVDDRLAELYRSARASCVLVVENDRAIGILTERDVVRLGAEQKPLDRLTLGQVMAGSPVTLRESEFTDLFSTITLLQQHRIRHLPVLDERERPIGLITHESLRHISRSIGLLRLRLVSEVMSREVIRTTRETSLLSIARLMAEHRVGSVVIVEPPNGLDRLSEIPVGIITERDLVQFQTLESNWGSRSAGEMMSCPVPAVKPEDTLQTVRESMERLSIRRAIVTGERGELLGIVTQTSLLQAINPVELYHLAKILEERVIRLEEEKISLLESRAVELERQVENRTAALKIQAERQKLLVDLAADIRSSLDLPTILETTVERVRQVLACDRVSIWLFESDGQATAVAESTDSPLSLVGEQVNDTCFHEERIERYRQGKIFVVPDIYTAEIADCHRKMLIRLHTRAKILVPLVCEGELWGFLSATESQHPRNWETEEVELLQALSVQLAIALQQAITHQRLQKQLTARQQTEVRLRESEERYATLVSAAPVGIFRTDVVGQCLYVNDRWLQITGLDSNAALGSGWQQGLHPDDRERVFAEWEDSIRENRPFRLEYRFQRPDGTVSWVYGQSASERDDRGRIVGYVGTITDIGDRVRAEKQLQEIIEGTAATTGKDFFPALASHIAAALNVSYVLVSERAEDRLNALAFRARGVFSSPFSYSIANTPCERTLQEGKFYRESGLQAEFPEAIALVEMGVDSYLGIALHDTEGRAIGSLCILDKRPIRDPRQAENLLRVFAARASAELERERARRDIERMNQELERQVEERTAALKTGEERWHLVLKGANDGIWDWDVRTGRVFYSDRWKTMRGFDPEEVGDRLEEWSDAIHPEDSEPVMAALDDHFAGKTEFFEMEYRVRCKDGSYLWILDRGKALRDESGRVIRMSGSETDISARKQAEEALERYAHEVEDLYNNAPCGYHSLDAEGRYIRVNETELKWLGYRREEMLGRPISDFLTPASRRVFRDNYPSFRARGWIKNVEYEMIREDGTILPVILSATAVTDGDGNYLYSRSTLMDIRERQQAEQVIRQQAERETLLREITQRIRESLDIRTIFDTACREIRQVLRADRVGIFRFFAESNFDDGEFVAESVLDGFPSVLKIIVHDHCFGDNFSDLYSRGRFYAVEDIYNGGMTTCHTDILARFEVRANLVMPLLRGDELWGLLCVHQCSTTRHWQKSEIDFTQQLANQLAIAIQQADLYERVQDELRVRQQVEARIALQLRQQQTLGAIAQKIRESLDIGEILTTVTQQVKDVLNADRALVFQLFADGRARIVEEAVSSDFPARKNPARREEIWPEAILDRYRRGTPQIVADATADPLADGIGERSIDGRSRSRIVAPILQDAGDGENHRRVARSATHKLWGVLVVQARAEKRVWQESEAELLQQIANWLAIALQQTTLFDRLQRELNERQQAQLQLTERNQQLAISNEELARATRLKDEFLANMSHELRTPLNAILGMTEGLQDRVFGEIAPEQIRALQTIERSGSHLLELINDILDVAKIESGQLELDIAPIAATSLCRSSLAFIKQQALKKGVRVEMKLPDGLPDLLVDERRVRQVLINLLNNAVKFTPPGGSITLEVSRPGRETAPDSLAGGGIYYPSGQAAPVSDNLLRVAVRDTGIGIAPESLDKLFRPFIQIDSALNRQYTGTGLGLALVKRIVELHGGRVGVISEVGSGSRFTIDLPAVVPVIPAPEPDLPTETEDAPSPAIETDPTDEKPSFPLILLAEDNEANIMTISGYLKARGYRLLSAKNGREAVSLVRSDRPDLILMDIQMPEVDGLEAIRQIRLDFPAIELPIIALTALAMPADRERCLAAGANDYFSKPVKLKELTIAIRQWLQKR
ncbi:GAF domain-containing protein [Pannus brasiliensis CCIBt3594]|uniref:Circadian input-output histidine kinase CikA n=1 Tax=Pannus brasiliensis CCIBt3594 TaxID=1427578 RepID=A0AAW9QKG0_9CHRO